MAHTPLQKRVILALENGGKLHEILCEPGMPRKDMVDEWRNNPEFDADYLAAADKGKEFRIRRGGRQSPDDPGIERTPAVLREAPAVIKSTRQAAPVLLDAADEPEDVAPVPGFSYTAAGEGTEPAAKPAPKKNGPQPTHGDAQLRAIIIKGLSEGFKIAEIIRVTRGLSAVRLAQLRKDSHFVLKYDEAKKQGKGKTPATAPVTAADVADTNVGNITPAVENPAPAVDKQKRFLVVPETDDLCFPDLGHAIENAKASALKEGRGYVVVEIVCTANVRTTVEVTE